MGKTYSRYIKLRDEKGVTDTQVSVATGIGKSTFSDWKSGRSVPKLDKLQKLANFFEVPIGDFLGGPPGPKEPIPVPCPEKKTRGEKSMDQNLKTSIDYTVNTAEGVLTIESTVRNESEQAIIAICQKITELIKSDYSPDFIAKTVEQLAGSAESIAYASQRCNEMIEPKKEG